MCFCRSWGVDVLRGGYKAKPGAEVRKRSRSRVVRRRVRKPGTRAVGRRTAEQNAPHSHAGSGYIGIEVVREVGRRTAANLSRHILAELSGKYGLNVTFLAGKVAPVVVAVIAAVLELRRVVANVELRQPAVRVALYLTLAAVRPAPNMPKGVF